MEINAHCIISPKSKIIRTFTSTRRDKQPVDSSDSKDPCDIREGRDRERQRTGEAHFTCIPSCQTLSVPNSSIHRCLCLLESPYLPTNNTVHVLTSGSCAKQTFEQRSWIVLLYFVSSCRFDLSLSFSSSGKRLLFQETLSSFFPPETSYFFNSFLLPRIALELLNVIYQIPSESSA